MGSYLSEPITEKKSVDEENDKLIYGASSMQGWRESQEDAHNSILDFDKNISYFAVYDGHGGHEVAQYCSQKLPDFIKNTDAYKKGELEQALIDGFLGFDSTISTAEIISALKEIASDREIEESDEENVNNLYEEAFMPIEKVIQKYINLVDPTIESMKKGEKLPRSPMITSKIRKTASVASGSNNSEEAGSSKNVTEESNCKIEVAECSNREKDDENDSSNTKINGEEKNDIDEEDPLDISTPQNGNIPQIKLCKDESDIKTEPLINDNTDTNSDKLVQNGDLGKEEETDQKNTVTTDIVTNKIKGKSLLKKSPKTPNTRPKRNATQLYKRLLDYQEDSEDESDDDEDKTFVGPGEESSDEESANASINKEDESSEDGEEEEEEDDEEEEEDDEDEDNEGDLEFARNMKEEPGSDSGCTAVVALLKGTELFVANAGDSRCIICRNGKAVEMSFDHKPEDEPEKNRIIKAGGKVTADGRVNGGLNLSRAIGDHAYKQNKDLNDKEQMITALPDIKKININPSEDEFMVLACDGIWNFMSSQEVVEFVKPRLDVNPKKLSQICEEMFDHCLAPDTMGDGTGCDNMTAIIVKFKSNIKKRQASPEPLETDSDIKRVKTDVKSEESSL